MCYVSSLFVTLVWSRAKIVSEMFMIFVVHGSILRSTGERRNLSIMGTRFSQILLIMMFPIAKILQMSTDSTRLFLHGSNYYGMNQGMQWMSQPTHSTCVSDLSVRKFHQNCLRNMRKAF